jgi:hypothetical protein
MISVMMITAMGTAISNGQLVIMQPVCHFFFFLPFLALPLPLPLALFFCLLFAFIFALCGFFVIACLPAPRVCFLITCTVARLQIAFCAL